MEVQGSPIMTDGAESEQTKSSENSEDLDLKMLNTRRMLELRRRASAHAKKIEETKSLPLSDRQVLLKALVDRGDEVLVAAEAAYPTQTKDLISQIAMLIRQGKITTISGGELLQFFRSIGMRVSVRTSISVQDHGKFVSLAEKLKKGD